MPTERLILEIDEKGARVVERNVSRIGEGAKKSDDAVKLLRRTLGLLATGATIRALLQYSDAFTRIQNQLRGATTSSQQLTEVTQRLFEVAQRTRQDFETTVGVYDRISNVQKDLGITQDRAIKLQEQLNQAVLASGGNLQQAAEPLSRFVTGLADGSLKGIELTRTLNQLPGVARVIADHLKVNIGELAALADQGKITSQTIIAAFDSQEEKLRKQAEETVPTLREAFTTLNNELINQAGALNKNTGAVDFLAKSMISLSKNMGTVISAAKALIPLLTIVFAQQLVALGVKAVNSTTSAINGLTEGMKLLTTTGMAQMLASLKSLTAAFNQLWKVILANPLVAVGAVAIGAFILQADALKRKEAEVEAQEEKVHKQILEHIRARRAQVVANKEASESFTKFIDALKQENELLKLSEKDREVRQALLEAEKAVGHDLTDQQERQVAALVRQKQALEEANIPLEERLGLLVKQREFQQQAAQLEGALASGKDITDVLAPKPRIEAGDLKGPLGIDQTEVEQTVLTLGELGDEMAYLNHLFRQGVIDQGEYERRMSDLRQTADEFTEGQRLAAAAITSAFDSAIQGLTDSTRTFRDFFMDIANDIFNLTSRILLSQGLAALGLPAFQHGGSFQVGGSGGPDSQMVAFAATPGERVNVSTSTQQQQGQQGQAAPVVVPPPRVVVNFDPRSMLDTLNTSAGDRTLLSFVQRNPAQIKRALGG